jgi:hypothetical protein
MVSLVSRFYPCPAYNRKNPKDKFITDFSRAARKITWVLFATQSLTSAGFIAAATIDPILGARLTSNLSLATLSTTAFTGCSAACFGFIPARCWLGSCFVGGSTLLAGQVSPAEGSRTQGFSDLLVGLASAASLSSGFIFTAMNYTIISIVAGGLALVPLVMSLLWMRKNKPAVVTA